MKTYITTIEELKGKSRRELIVLFRNAINAASVAERTSPEGRAAERTVRNALYWLGRPDGP